MPGAAGYAERSRHYSAEIAHTPEPALLDELLRRGLRVAEVPSGTGHFLHAYAAAGAEVTLIDACPEMLQAARRQAAALQVRSLRTGCCRIRAALGYVAGIERADRAAVRPGHMETCL